MNIKHFISVTMLSSLLVSVSLTSCSDDDNLLPVPGISPNESFITEDHVAFSCDFQDAEKAKSLFDVYDFSNLTPTKYMTQIGFAAGEPWLFTLQDSYDSKNYFAGATSSFSPAGTADAWLVTKAIEIPDSGYVLSWKSEALDTLKRDGLQVYISDRGGNPKTDFGEPVWEVEQEEAGATDLVDGEWQEHELALDKYIGKTIHVAFVNRSTDKSVICLDDVLVMRPRPYVIELDMERVNLSDEIEVRGHITAGSRPITDYDIHYTMADSVVRTEHYTDLDIQPGESHSFVFTKKITPAVKGVYNGFKVWANVAGRENVGVVDSVVSVSFIPTSRVLLEEGTGMWCGYCPLGILSTEHLMTLYPDALIPVAVHNKDVLCDPDYDVALGFMSFPSGLVNRNYACQPMAMTTNNYTYEGEGTFLSAVQEALKDDAILEPSIESAVLSGNSINVKSSVKFAIVPPAGHTFRIAYILTENNVTVEGAAQHNYLSTSSLPILGEFGKGGKYGQENIVGMPYNDVARGIYPEFKGAADILPSVVEADKAYDTSYTINLEGTNYSSADNLYVTVAVIDAATGHVVNSVRAQVK